MTTDDQIIENTEIINYALVESVNLDVNDVICWS